VKIKKRNRGYLIDGYVDQEEIKAVKNTRLRDFYQRLFDFNPEGSDNFFVAIGVKATLDGFYNFKPGQHMIDVYMINGESDPTLLKFGADWKEEYNNGVRYVDMKAILEGCFQDIIDIIEAHIFVKREVEMRKEA